MCAGVNVAGDVGVPSVSIEGTGVIALEGVGVEVAIGSGEGEPEEPGVGGGVSVPVDAGVGEGIDVSVAVGDATVTGGEPVAGLSSDSELHPPISRAKKAPAVTIPNLDDSPTTHPNPAPRAKRGSRSSTNSECSTREIIFIIRNVSTTVS